MTTNVVAPATVPGAPTGVSAAGGNAGVTVPGNFNASAGGSAAVPRHVGSRTCACNAGNGTSCASVFREGAPACVPAIRT